MARYVYPPGWHFPDHAHDVDKIDAVVSGRFRLVIAGHMAQLGPGDWVEVPRGRRHTAAVVGEEPVVSLDAIKVRGSGPGLGTRERREGPRAVTRAAFGLVSPGPETRAPTAQCERSDMKIVMFGAGGVGGYFGGRLAQAGCDVSFVARGAHLDALRRDGLRLTSPKGDAHLTGVRASDDPRELGPADVVFFTVKLYDAERSAAQLAPLIGPGTMVVTLQNGVDAVGIVERHVGRAHTAAVAAAETRSGVREPHLLLLGTWLGAPSPGAPPRVATPAVRVPPSGRAKCGWGTGPEAPMTRVSP